MLLSSGRFPAVGRSDMRTHCVKAAVLVIGLGSAALTAAPAGAAVGDYQAALKETISSGVANANPVVSLDVAFGTVNGGAPVPTGGITYRVDAGHLAPGAWKAIEAAPAGTRLGTFSSVLTGASPTDVRLQGVGRDAHGPLVHATIGVDRTIAQEIGSSIIPIVLRQTIDAKHVTISVNLQSVVGKLAALGLNSTAREATVTLQGKIAYGGALHAITLNPQIAATLTNIVTTQACAQPACSSLRVTAQQGVATVHLPKQVTLQAPELLSYGYRYSIGGTGRPGDQITLSALGSDGALLASPWSADVRPDGTFEVRATVRSAFDSKTNELIRPAAARYVASATEGNATVLAVAGNDTRVTLVKPLLHIQRKAGGTKLHFSVRVPGADANVKVRIELGSRTIADGTTNAAGRFTVTLPSPIKKGNLRAVASVPGADTAISNPIAFSIF